jgi:hypothetical protein
MNTGNEVQPIPQPPAAAPPSENNIFKKIKNATTNSGNVPMVQTILIVFLTVFLILALLGINIFTAIGKLFQSAFDVIKPVTYNTIGDIAYTSGSVIDNTSNLLTDTGKRGLDIVNGTIQDIGNLLIKSSGKVEEKKEEKKEGYSTLNMQTAYSPIYAELEKDAYKTNSIYDPTKYASIQ